MNKIKEQLIKLPKKSGCYLMKDFNGNVIYVGKAKNLSSRVKSYFSGSHNKKTTKMVSHIDHFEYIITNNESEALILEMNLIKEYDPKYNILLTDDKIYPYILVTKEKHPRILVVRTINKKSGKYFGPYPNVASAREVAKLLNKLYPLRKCNRLPNKECLYYRIKQCIGPCIHTIDDNVYLDMKKNIYKFLNGNHYLILKDLRKKMEDYSFDLKYEEAANIRDLIKHIEVSTEKQNIVINDFIDRDIFGFYNIGDIASINIFFMRAGKIYSNATYVFDFVGEFDDVIQQFILKYYNNKPLPKEILTTEYFDESVKLHIGTNIVVPKQGEKLKLVNLSIENAKENVKKEFDSYKTKIERTIQATEELGELLGLRSLRKIEAFDNSNIMGTNAVSGMVVFIDGKPSKKDYRKFKIKTVQGSDDYSTMKEVVYRRYRRLLMEKKAFPDLLLVDGGKGQITVAKEVLKDLNIEIPIIGLVKDKKHKTSFLLDCNFKEHDIKSKKNIFYLLNKIQEEVHRYAITFHKNIRSKNMFTSILDNIEGVGEKTRVKLLKKCDNIYQIKKLSIKDLTDIGISEKVSINIKKYLNENLIT